VSTPSQAWRRPTQQGCHPSFDDARNVSGPSVDRFHHDAENADLLRDFIGSLEVTGYSPHTVRSFRHAVQDFLDFLTGLDLRAVTQREIREWLHWMTAQGCGRHTLVQRRYALGSFFKFLERLEVVPSSPVRLIRMRNAARKLPRFLTPEQMDRLIAAAADPRERALIETLYATGARLAELSAMRVEDINWSARTIPVLGKGGKGRLTFIGTKAVEALKLYLKDRSTGPVFLTADQCQWQRHNKLQGGLSLNKRDSLWMGWWRESRQLPDGSSQRVLRGKVVGRLEDLPTREKAREAMQEKLADVLENLPPVVVREMTHQRALTQRGISRILAEAGMRAGLGHVHPHMIRHAFATALHENGADIRYIQELLGHANVSTTQIYTHVSLGHSRSVLERCHPRWGGNDDEHTEK
jgi:site-specific recombinase XerD